MSIQTLWVFYCFTTIECYKSHNIGIYFSAIFLRFCAIMSYFLLFHLLLQNQCKADEYFDKTLNKCRAFSGGGNAIYVDHVS